MYLRHFAFTRFPFENTLEADELYASTARREAEARLKHLIELRGIGLLTGEVGSGKTTVCRRVVQEDPRVEFSVSHTTRARRDGEVEGIDYHFVTHERFQEMIREDAFLEWAEYDGRHYGTSWASIERPLGQGRAVEDLDGRQVNANTHSQHDRQQTQQTENVNGARGITQQEANR